MFPASERKLSAREIMALPVGFTSQFDIRNVRLIDRHHNPFAIGKILARPEAIYWKNHPQDFTRLSLPANGLLMHELCHIWQYKTGRLTALRYLFNPHNWQYGYNVRDGAKFDDYHTEQQADLVQDWFLMNHDLSPRRYARQSQRPAKAWINGIVPFNWNLTTFSIA